MKKETWEDKLEDYYMLHEKPVQIGLDLEQIKSFIRQTIAEEKKLAILRFANRHQIFVTTKELKQIEEDK